MEVTNYIFRVITKHPETLRNFRALVEAIDNNKFEGYHVEQSGRIRRWVYIEEKNQYFRVVFLPDGKTVFNIFANSGNARKK